MKTFILCGGLGTRISKIPDVKVKILAPIGSKVFFDYFIKWLELSSCYTEDLILAMGFNAGYNNQNKNANTKADPKLLAPYASHNNKNKK